MSRSTVMREVDDLIEGYEGHIAALATENRKLWDALECALAWFHDPDSDSMDQWERIASEFHRDTGYLRPGKDYPLESPAPDDLNEIWGEWTLRRTREVFAKLRAARGEA